jgi:hypothetical protein
MRNVYRAVYQKTERKKRLLRKFSVYGKTLKLVFNKQHMSMATGFIRIRMGSDPTVQ